MKHIIIVLLVLLSACTTGNAVLETSNNQADDTLTIGAILPLSGAAAVWGEDLSKGMRIAAAELAVRNIDVKIIFEDSASSAQQGVDAYHKLILSEPDAVVSLFSRVSVPLIALSEEHKTPLVMTVVAAEGVTEQSEYAFRLFATPEQYVISIIPYVQNEETVAIVALNDEYGVSVSETAEKLLIPHNIEVVTEFFDPGTTDFHTIITKIQRHNPGAVLFVGAFPQEIAGFMKNAIELGLRVPIHDVSVLLSIPAVRANMAVPDDTRTIAFSESKYNNLVVDLGYDAVMLLAEAKQRGDIHEELIGLEYDGAVGHLVVQENGEINPETISVLA